jgi:hypothetical protein
MIKYGFSTLFSVALIFGGNQVYAHDPQPQASPSAATPPNPIVGPALGLNDPCTTLSEIVTRPSQTTSVCTVRPNHVLIETGYQNTTFDSTSSTVQYPQALVRIGTTIPGLELDVAPASVARTNAGGSTIAGTTDFGAGIKYVIGYTPKLNYGANVLLTAPTGSSSFSAGGTNALYNLNYGYTISPIFSLAGTFGLLSQTNGIQRWSTFSPSLMLMASLPNATTVGAEIATFTNAVAPGSAARIQYLVDLSRAINQRVQVDVEMTRSPTSLTGRNHSLGFGISYYY